MRTWQRANREVYCGGCTSQTLIPIGSPVLVIELADMKNVFYRGQCCAGPAPPDLPIAGQGQQRTKRLTAFKDVAAKWDVKARASGERIP